MKCLFIVQGEGRGHCTQAIALKEILNSINIQVSSICIGKNHTNRNHDWVYDATHLPKNYFYSPNFVYKNNKVNLFLTACKSLKNVFNIKKGIFYLKNQIELHKPDFIVNFYEPLAPLANLNSKIPIITVGHQFMINHPQYPKNYWLKKKIISFFNKFVALNSKHIIALSYYPANNIDNINVAPPLLRKSILRVKTKITPNKVCIYVVNSEVVEDLLLKTNEYPKHKFVIYNEKYTTKTKNTVCKLISADFTKDLLSAEFVVCSGGFETVCESLYHNKKILAVPTPNHTEQMLNCIDAKCNNIAITNNDYNLSILLNKSIKNKNINKFNKSDYLNYYINFFNSFRKDNSKQ